VTLIWGIGVLVNFYDAFIDSDRHSKAVETEIPGSRATTL